jgi:hypothetical protein
MSDKTNPDRPTLMCPSAEPEMDGGVIFGIVAGTATEPRMVHFDRVKPVTPEILAFEGPIKPTEVFRIAATCIETGCQHFDGQDCRLTQRIIDNLPIVAETVPPCPIRSTCRWWYQEGKAACLRCQQVVRDNYHASEELFNAVDPSVYNS